LFVHSSVYLEGGKRVSTAVVTDNISSQPDRANNDKKAAKLNTLIECADQLLSAGLVGIYNMSYEAIEISMAVWEYRFDMKLIFFRALTFSLCLVMSSSI
jgi:hypothetical protein